MVTHNEELAFGLSYMHMEVFPRSKCLNHKEENKVMRHDIVILDTWRTSHTPTQPLKMKLTFYMDHFLHLTKDKFGTSPQYMDTHLSSGL